MTSHHADGVRIITLHDRFILHNTTKSPLVMSSVVAPISNIRVSNDQVYQYPRRLDSTHSLESVHLTADTISISGAAALFLAFSHDKSGKNVQDKRKIYHFYMLNTTLSSFDDILRLHTYLCYIFNMKMYDVIWCWHTGTTCLSNLYKCV